MANREELRVIRGARAGDAGAQLELGKLYLMGSAGLPKSLPTALHWLDRAAEQACAEACALIGTHIPFELASRSNRPLARWYERAFDAGLVRAGLVFAQLVLLDKGASEPAPALRAKALAALNAAAVAGLADAQWLLARQQGGPVRAAAPVAAPAAPTVSAEQVDERWLQRAAESGVPGALHALLDRAWTKGQWAAFLQRALPVARALVQQQAPGKLGARLSPEQVLLLSRCAQALSRGQPGFQADSTELQHFWDLAASHHDRDAQLAVGLWFARMEIDGRRTGPGSGAANFKKAIRWLTLSGEQGLAAAWYALSRIYIKPEFSQRNVVDAQRYLERAAEMGFRDAQLECGLAAWRTRREHEGNDVRALYWLQKAAAQGCLQAGPAIGKIAPRANGRPYTGMAAPARAHALADSHPLLAARLELAAMFGLTRAEALLLDVKAADQGHCLVIDIRSSYGRSKRRLVALETAHERMALDRIARLFDNMDGGPNGPEGNYRQRLYRLKSLAPELAGGGLDDSLPYEMAA